MKVQCEQTSSSPIFLRVRVSTFLPRARDFRLERLVETFQMRLYLFIYFLDVDTDQRELFFFWVHDDLGMKTCRESRFEKRLVLFFVIVKRVKRFCDDVEGFRGSFCLILFIFFVLFFFSPPPPAT